MGKRKKGTQGTLKQPCRIPGLPSCLPTLLALPSAPQDPSQTAGQVALQSFGFYTETKWIWCVIRETGAGSGTTAVTGMFLCGRIVQWDQGSQTSEMRSSLFADMHGTCCLAACSLKRACLILLICMVLALLLALFLSFFHSWYLLRGCLQGWRGLPVWHLVCGAGPERPGTGGEKRRGARLWG